MRLETSQFIVQHFPQCLNPGRPFCKLLHTHVQRTNVLLALVSSQAPITEPHLEPSFRQVGAQPRSAGSPTSDHRCTGQVPTTCTQTLRECWLCSCWAIHLSLAFPTQQHPRITRGCRIGHQRGLTSVLPPAPFPGGCCVASQSSPPRRP